ncbi:MAG TPA: TonB-dependent receptor [Marinobacter sp.]|nr:TonB-dependent receptor [Marinobacter sp.]
MIFPGTSGVKNPFLLLSSITFVLITPMTAKAAPQSLSELVVVGSRAPTQISQIPGSVWVLEEEELEQQFRSGQDLKTVLGKLVPGMDLAPETRTNFGQNVRGRSVLVMIDGVSMNGSRGLSRQFDSIDPFNIERIEVLSGATAIYGGGSTGGIVNIITKKGEAGDTRFSTELGVSSGFNDSEDRKYRMGQSISGGSDSLKGRLAIAVQDNGAMYDGTGNQILTDITQTDLQYNRSVDIMGSTQFRIDSDQSVSLMAQLYDSRYMGNKGLWLGENLQERTSPEIRSGFTSDRSPETDRYLLNATYQNQDFLGHTAYLQVSTRHEASSFHPYPYPAFDKNTGELKLASSYYGASKQNTDQHLVKALLVKDLGDLTLSYGIDLDREDFSASQMVFDNTLAFGSGGLTFEEDFTVPRYPDYRVDGITAFLQAEWQATDKLQLNAGVRQRYSTLKMNDFVPTTQQIAVDRGVVSGADAIPGGENNYQVTLVNAGAIYNLTDDHQVWANVSQGFEIPDPGKVAGRGTYAIQGGRYVLTDYLDIDDNAIPGLKTHQVELGWRTYRNRWDAQVATYYTWSDKEAKANSNLQIEILDAKTRDYGIEGSLAYRATDQVSLGTTGHYIRSEVQDANGKWEKNVVTYASLPKATVFTQWQDSLNRVRLQASHSFDIDDDKGQEIDGVTLLDLQADRKLPVGRVNFAVSNLLDKDYQTVWGQRAQLFYGARFAYEPYDFKGQGRTYTLTYAADY